MFWPTIIALVVVSAGFGSWLQVYVNRHSVSRALIQDQEKRLANTLLRVDYIHNALLDRPVNWDSYGGLAPIPEAVERAMCLYREILTEQPVVDSAADGTVCLEWPSGTNIVVGRNDESDELLIVAEYEAEK